MVFHSVVDFNLHIPSNAILFSLILGLAVSSAQSARAEQGARGKEQSE
jgi:hypothetical protein